jgi:uncharacterized OB-fold protein
MQVKEGKMIVAVCAKCGRHIEVDTREILFGDDGFGFIYCPFCEDDQTEIKEFMDVKGEGV